MQRTISNFEAKVISSLLKCPAAVTIFYMTLSPVLIDERTCEHWEFKMAILVSPMTCHKFAPQAMILWLKTKVSIVSYFLSVTRKHEQNCLGHVASPVTGISSCGHNIFESMFLPYGVWRQEFESLG